MLINDIVWDLQPITDDKVTQLINHPSFLRLQKIYISAYGYLFDLKRNSTRYEHSLGVYFLLKHFGASENEQIAGLLHDVAHTAFSHLSTYVLQGAYTGEAEFHELMSHKFVKESGIADLLTKLGIDPQLIMESRTFTLLENNLPNICADRLDYTLRDGLHLQILSKQKVQKILNSLSVSNGQFVFTNQAAAFDYAFCFYLLNMLYYGCPSEAHFNNDFGGLIKRAMEKGVLTEADWFSDDVSVIATLRASSDKEIKDWLALYDSNLVLFEDTQNPTKIYSKKVRVVDPPVLGDFDLQWPAYRRLSELDPLYKRLLDDYTTTHQKHELSVRIVRKQPVV